MRIKKIPQHPHIPVYRNDGTGTDTYISFNDGGFGQYRYDDIKSKDAFEFPTYVFHQDLSSYKPMKRYFMNGTGRDRYVYQSMLDERDKCSGNLRLNNILRSYESPMRKTHLSNHSISPSKFEQKLINRIFYGKCPGLSDRRMSPKVKFGKKWEKKEEDDNNYFINENDNSDDEKNKSNSSIDYNKNKNVCNTINVNHSPKKSFTDNKDINNSKTLDQEFCNNSMGGVCQTESNAMGEESPNKNNNTTFMSPRRTKRNYRPEIGKNDDLVMSVKKIFLFNNKVKKTPAGNTIYSRLKDNTLASILKVNEK